MSAILGAFTGTVGPSGDQSGAADSAALNAIGAAGGGASLKPGATYYLNSTVTLNGTELNCRGATIIPVSGITGSMFTLAGNQARLYDAQLYGGTLTRANNPAVDAIAPAAGALRWSVEDINPLYINGWAINPAAATGPMHGTIRAVKGTNCAGGIRIFGGTSTNGQVNISDIDLQSMEVNEALYLSAITDIELAMCNLSVQGPAAVPTVHISDSCQTILASGMDCGVTGTPTAGVGVLLIEDANAHSPSEIDITSGVFQQGGVGVILNGGCARLKFRGVFAKRNQGDGWQSNGTGTAIALTDCGGNTNNQAAGTAYDVNVTSTAHVGLFNFQYCSTTVTNSRNITSVSNHVSDVNATNPGGKVTAGQAPAGW